MVQRILSDNACIHQPWCQGKLLVDADTAVTGVAAAEEQHLKLLPLLPWHQLLLL